MLLSYIDGKVFASECYLNCPTPDPSPVGRGNTERKLAGFVEDLWIAETLKKVFARAGLRFCGTCGNFLLSVAFKSLPPPAHAITATPPPAPPPQGEGRRSQVTFLLSRTPGEARPARSAGPAAAKLPLRRPPAAGASPGVSATQKGGRFCHAAPGSLSFISAYAEGYGIAEPPPLEGRGRGWGDSNSMRKFPKRKFANTFL